jgi:small conductance mechanosensitive channel
MADETADQGVIGFLQTYSDQIAASAREYGYLVADSLSFILVGMLAVFVIHKLASRFLYPHVDNKRFWLVTFGTLYLLVLVVTGILVLKEVGFDVSTGGPIAILVVLFLAVLVYLVLPFLPRLPFLPGHMVVAHGEMGVVDTISSFHTTIRKFDGTTVFIPNAMIWASKILNYSYTPHRRIEMELSVAVDSDLDTVKTRLLAIAANEHRVLGDPAPVVHVMGADASGVHLTLFCWVENADFMATRTDLWGDVLQLVREDPAVALSPPLQEVRVVGEG